ncbi:MAG: hypothetical protein WC069_02355 [Candidatus Shapirobacteria bacterium]
MKNKFAIIIILCVSLFLTFRLMRPGMWSVQDDLHIFRLSEYDLCLKSGQIPCRYSPNSALGFGSPVFNFYPPVTYALGELFHFTGISFSDSTKIVYLLPLFFGPIFMYLFASVYFGSMGGLISALVFAIAPYQALNLVVRGALAENFALNLVPVIFYLKVTKKQNLSILFLTILFLTHQLTTLYAIGLLILFSLKQLKPTLIIIAWSLGLSSFFLIPSFLEKGYTTNFLMTQGYFNYIIHFATLKQLFVDRFWGYGASLWGPKDDMSFQIGYLQWILPTTAVLVALYKNNKHKYLILITYIVGIFFTFLTHNKSTFIWQLFPFMAYFQFPWRFVGGAILCFSFISGSIIFFIPKKIQKYFVAITLALLVIFNYSFFHEDQWSLSGSSLIAQQGAGLTDFYPKFSTNFPTVETPPVVTTSNGTVTNLTFTKNSKIAYGQVTVESHSATINLPVAYFPKMELRLDTQKISYRINPDLGQIQFDVPNGTHHFYLQFTDTPIRTLSNYISLLFIIAFIIKIIRVTK